MQDKYLSSTFRLIFLDYYRQTDITAIPQTHASYLLLKQLSTVCSQDHLKTDSSLPNF